MDILTIKNLKLILLVFLGIAFNQTYACTDFLLVNSQNNVVVGRSMEFGTNLESEIVIYPKNQKKISLLDNNRKGLSWTSKYAYIAITSFGMDLVADGMNEKGLSIGTLWFPGAKYPPIKSGNNTIALEDVGSWILGSFSTVEEVKKAFQSISIWAHVIEQLKEVPPIHLSLHDRLGKSVVIEFIDKKIEILDNPIGVLTNVPKFEWHITNLRNYINLSAINKKPAIFDGTVINPTGQGTGLLGIPGDWTPPSRFVKIALIKNFAKKTKTPDENVNLAFHLLNTVDIPYGVVRSSDGKDFDHTKWVVVKDLTNNMFYYRTYKDLTIKKIDLSKEFAKLKNKEKKIKMLGE